MTVKVIIKPPLKKVQARYAASMKKVTSFRSLYASIAIWLDRWNKLNFKTEGGKVGGWRPLALGGRWTGTKGSRTFDASAKLLQDTGRLRLSFLPIVDSKGGGVGSDLDYAEAHQKGWGALPQRRMIPKKTEVIDDVMRIADAHTDKALKHA